MYSLGFTRGYEQGFLDASSLTLAKSLSGQLKSSDLTAEYKNQILATAELAKKHSPIITGHGTVKELANQVSTFYADPANRHVCWNDAVLFAAATLQGQPPTEQDLGIARKAGLSSGCK